VQSVATRLVVERERERIAFRSASYWDIEGCSTPGSFARPSSSPSTAGASPRASDFDRPGELSRADVVHLDEAARAALAEALRVPAFTVRSVEDKPYKRSPARRS
jgi:DNA topoisomerase I